MKALIICMLTLQNTNFTNLPFFKIGHAYLSLFKTAKFGIFDYCTSPCVSIC